MKYFISLFLFLAVTLSATFSKANYTLTGSLSNLPNSKVFLASIKGDAYKIIDTVEMKAGTFIFNLPDDIQTGMLKIIPEISFKQNRQNTPPNSLDIIFNHENISLKTKYPWLQDSLVILESKENKVYYDILKQESSIQAKLKLLDPLLVQYPSKDEFYTSLIKQYNSLQKERAGLIKQAVRLYSGSFAAGLLAMKESPFLDAHLSEQQRLANFKQYYFTKLDFSDERLINSNAYTTCAIRYLSLYRNPQLNQADITKELIRAADTILVHTNHNPVVFDFILTYLMDGFEKLNLQSVLDHLANNYTSFTCTPENKNMLQRRLDSYRIIIAGTIAPDFKIIAPQQNEVQLSKLTNEFVLLVFWSSSCPHCEELLPQLKRWYDAKTIDLEVVAISLDTTASAWRNVIEKNKYNWLNICELKGWDGKIPLDYNIYATPTMFLIDRSRKILAKPLNFEAFLSSVKKL